MRNVSMIAGLAVVVVVGCGRDAEQGSARSASAGEPQAASGAPRALPPSERLAERTISITTSSSEARAEFEAGRELFENMRHAEAAKRLARAIELDPKFAQAHALLGMVTPGEEGRASLERAVEASETLPPAEHLYVKVQWLRRSGRRDEHAGAVRKLADVAAGDPRAQVALALVQQDQGQLDAARQSFQRALAAEPTFAPAHNYLAYLYANGGELEQAVASATRYAELRPGEPNPLDSLGEIQMMAGKLAEAEASFRRALEIEPSFSIAWEGVAMTKLYRSDFAGAVKALRELEAAADSDKSRHKAQKEIAWVQAAAGDLDAALATVAGIDGRSGSFMRVELLMAAGKLDHAAKALQQHIQAIEGDDPTAHAERAWSAIPRVELAVERGELEMAAAALAEVERHAASIDEPYYVYAVEYARGMVALGSGDGAGALAHFAKIAHPLLPYGARARWREVQALERAGRPDDAARLRSKLSQSYRRDAVHAFLRASLSS